MGKILHCSNGGSFLFQIFIVVLHFCLSVTHTTGMGSNASISPEDYEELKRRFSALETRQASTEADISQVNAYIGSVGQLITRYIEIESKFDKVLEFSGEVQGMKQEIQLIKQSLDGVIKAQDLMNAVLEVKSNVEKLFVTLQVNHDIEEIKNEIKSLKKNVLSLSGSVNGTFVNNEKYEKDFSFLLSNMSKTITDLKEDVEVRLDNIAILHAQDNITMTEMFADGYRQVTENVNELEFKCQQNYSALQQMPVSEFVNLQRNVSRFAHNLTTCLNHTETLNNRVLAIENKGPVSKDSITTSVPLASLQTSTMIPTITTTKSTTATPTTTTLKTTSTTITPTTEATTTQVSSSETEFVIMFMRNFGTNNLQIMISSLDPTDVEVFTAFDSSRQNYSITSGTIRLNYSTSAVTGANAIENKGIYIKSKSKIFVNVINAFTRCCSDDSYTAIPIDFLGSGYAAVSTRYSNSYLNQIGVVAADDNTVITFHLKVSDAITYKGHTYNNGNKLQITLNKLQSFALSYKQTDEYETNMKVTGNKPFAMFSGNRCGLVKGIGCSYMVESAPPTALYGQTYIVPKLSGLFYQTGYLKFTPLNSTDVAFEDASKTLITLQTNSSSFESVDLSKPTVIPGKTPFLLTFYGRMNGSYIYSMINLPPLCRYSNNYTITTPSTRNYTNYISVVIETRYKSQLLLDNVALNNGTSSTFTLFGNYWSSLTLPIADGAHTLRHPDITVGFGLIQFGQVNGRSYGFPVHNYFLGPSKYCKQNSP